MHEISTQTYQKLVQSIDQEFQRGVLEVKKQLERQRLVTYWNVGQYIDDYIRIHHLHDKRQQQEFFRQLSSDTKRRGHFLRQLLDFFHTYPEAPEQDGVAWSHYRELIRIPTVRRRKQLERRIVKEGMQTDELYYLVHDQILAKTKIVENGDDGQVFSQQLECARGKLYMYRMISPDGIPWTTDSAVVDLGFGIRRETTMKVSASLKAGHYVVSQKSDHHYEIKRTDVSVASMYTYRAVVERVIDGDTIVANIDCGFQCWSHQRLRLRGINTPELSESGGVTAQRFVRRALKPCQWIIVKTYYDRQGKYGRYLADVFFDVDGCAQGNPQRVADKGVHLNQLLIDSGHANIYLSNV